MVMGGQDKVAASGVKDIKSRKVGVIACTAMFFAICCSGAFGIEEIIADSGPGVAILLLCVVPIVWGYPFAMICAELGSSVPVEGGADMWIKWGLGEFWFGISIIKDWVWSLTCNTTFIVLAVNYIEQGTLSLTDNQRYFLKVGLALILFVINCLGVKEAGIFSSVIAFLSLSIFVIISIVGFSQANQNPIEPFMNPDYEATPFLAYGTSLAIVMWCYSGYDEVAMFADEIDDADRVIPKATLIVVPLIAATFVIPALAGLSSVGQYEFWSEEPAANENFVGWYDVISLSPIAPDLLGVAFVIIAGLSMCSMYNMCMVVGSRCGLVMSDQHFGPKFLAKLSKKRRMPVPALLFLLIVTIAMIGTPSHQLTFGILVMFDAFFTVLHVCLTSITSAVLRRKGMIKEGIKGHFTVPGGQKGHNIMVGCILVLCPIFAFFQGLDYFLVCSVSLLSLPIFYILAKKIWKGSHMEDPIANPIDKRTGLGFGDLIKAGGFILGIGLASWFARWFYGQPLWEDEFVGGYVPKEALDPASPLFDPYAERMSLLYPDLVRETPFGNTWIPGYYESYYQGFPLEDFYWMLDAVMYVAIALTALGAILMAFGFKLRKTDHIQLDEIAKLK